MPLPLDGISVLDLSSRLPGPLCTQILADLGADVVKIEHPRSPDSFRSDPRLDGLTGGFFHIANRNKRAISLDLKQPRGREIFIELVKRADVLVEGFIPGTLERMELGYNDLAGANERLIYCSMSAFGADGPYRSRPAHDVNLLALSGILDLIGEKGGKPAIPPVQMAGVGSSLHAAVAILAALLQRGKAGRGTHIDVSMADGLAPFVALLMAQYLTGSPLPTRGENLFGGTYACHNVYRTRDGKYISLGCLEKKFWENLCRALGLEEFIEEQYATPPRQSEIVEAVGRIFLQRTLQEWLERLDPDRICLAPVNTLEEALQDPHIHARQTWFREIHPADGEIPQMAFPVTFSGRRPGWRLHPPSPGEHTFEILRDLGMTPAEIDALVDQGVI